VPAQQAGDLVRPDDVRLPQQHVDGLLGLRRVGGTDRGEAILLRTHPTAVPMLGHRPFGHRTAELVQGVSPHCLARHALTQSELSRVDRDVRAELP
jgi:hypothetical protein